VQCLGSAAAGPNSLVSRPVTHAVRLVSTLVAGMLSRNERPFLHVAETSTSAIAPYERLGFESRTHVTFRGFRTP
jgi:predicted GNAT family acetyltransferase